MKFKFDVQDDSKSFYNDPKMLGHHWAAETLNSIISLFKVVKTKKQKTLALALVDQDATSWHYFNNITNKEVKQWSYVLRRIDCTQPLDLLIWLQNKSGCLKNKLHHILESMSYKHNQTAYLDHYAKNRRFFGMDRQEAEERFHSYHAMISEKEYVKGLS